MKSLVLNAFSLLDGHARRKGVAVALLVLVAALMEGGGVGLIFPLIKLVGDPSAISAMPWLAAMRDRLAVDDRTFTFLAIASVAALIIAKNSLATFNVFFQFHFVFYNEALLSVRMFRKYLTLPWAEATRRNSAEMAMTCHRSVYNTFNNIVLATILLATEIAAVVAVLAVLFLLAPYITLIAGSVLFLCVTIFFLVFRKMFASYGRRDLELIQQNLKHIQQSFLSAKEIRALGRTSYFLDSYKALRMASNSNHRVYTALTQMPRLFLESVTVLCLLIVMAALFAQDSHLENQMAVLGLFAVAAFRLMPATNKIIFYLGQIRAAEAHAHKVFDDHAAPECDELDDDGQSHDQAFKDAIVLDGVSYRYPSTDADVLSNVSLAIRRGQSMAFVGGSGAGKTTLADLILGLLEPTSGQILIDGSDATLHLKSRRKLIGYVPQQVYLLDESLRCNVAFGIPENEIDDAKVRNAISQARLGEVVARLPQGIETIVGENGVRLSGGQRQRVGIARALYHNPQILVLDEATSALDNETEKEVTDAVHALSDKLTLVVIAHRLSTIRECDQIVLLESGHVVDAGTFDELTARCDLMKRFVRLGQLSPTGTETGPT